MKKEAIIDPQLESLLAKGVYWSHAVRVEKLIFLSGIAAEDKDRNIVGIGDIETQVRFIFDKMIKLLTFCGSDLDNVVKLTAFLLRKKDFVKYNDIRREFFGRCPGGFPASTTVIVAGLARDGYLLEVEATAFIP